MREELGDVLIAFDARIRDHVRQERISRKLAEFTIAPYADKKVSMMKMWPIAFDDEYKQKATAITSQQNLDTLRRFRENEAKRKLANQN